MPRKPLGQRQQEEIAVYEKIYQVEKHYVMGKWRKRMAESDLTKLAPVESYLDVSCGRAHLLDYMGSKERTTSKKVMGTEVATLCLKREDVVYAVAWDLPFEDNEFELVSFLDVIEHLVPSDTLQTVDELLRVARKTLLVSANNALSMRLNRQLHINIRTYKEWDTIFREAGEKAGFSSEGVLHEDKKGKGRHSPEQPGSHTWLLTSK